MKRSLSTLKVLLVAGALAAFFTSTQTMAAGSSPLYYSAATGNTYRAYYTEKGSPAASQNCVTKGGHLVVINSTPEWSDTVALLISLDASHDYWMGATLTTSGITTVTGQPYISLDSPPYPVLNASFPDGLTRYLDYSQTAQYWNWDLNAINKYYVCEFEHAPI